MQSRENWVVTAKRADFQELAARFGISPVLARLIRNRDVVGEEAIGRYLSGGIDDLYPPDSMKDLIKAAELISEKIRGGKRIRIIGDYDIDGVNATHILLSGLSRLGAMADTAIPDRILDGYGINKNLIARAHEAGVDTILTCDNGIAALDEIAYAKELGMTLIVTDHHDIPFRELEDGGKEILVSQADAIVNPKQADCSYPFDGLCGAAVAYKLVQYMYDQAGISREELYEFIQFAAIATVGDVMDLVDENRILVKEGLRRLKNTKNLGLAALIQASGIDPAQLSSYHIGFVLGPCINASGRLDRASRALELLQAKDRDTAAQIAGDLKALNDSRKSMTVAGTKQAIEQIEAEGRQKDKVLVVYLPDCHESLAGIIAGRVRERYNKPAFVITRSEEGAKGSGRSIEAYHMFDEMSRCSDVFTKFGGHPMAAGFSLPEENISLMRQRLNENASLTEEDFIAKVSIDVAMPISYISEELVQELELLEPFGKANSKPVFAQKDLYVRSARILGKNKNVLKMQVAEASQGGTVLDALYFGDVDAFRQYLEEKWGTSEAQRLFYGGSDAIAMSFTYYPSVNEYNGRRSLQIVIQNYR